MAEMVYRSVQPFEGRMGQKSSADPAAFERANYMKALISYTGGVKVESSLPHGEC